MAYRFSKENIFSYNYEKRRKTLIIVSIILVLFFIFSTYYILFLRNADVLLVRVINTMFESVFLEIKNLTLLGAFYTTLVGGLFFVTVPIEIMYLLFLQKGNSAIILIPIYLTGLIISYSINYFIGLKLNHLAKRLISYKRFYKIKSQVNKYGAWAVFFFNIIPLPSQPLAAVLGVFRYDKFRFYFFFIMAQFLKYVWITLAYLYIF